MTDEFCIELADSLAVLLLEMKADLDDFVECNEFEPAVELEGIH